MTYKFCPICGLELTKGIVDGRERFFCSADSCDFVHWNSPVPVVAAIVERNDHVVLARNKAWPEKMYGLITGFLEQNELPEEGVLREVQEELGLSGKVMEFIGFYPFFQKNQIILAFHVAASNEQITLGEELVAVKEVPWTKVRPWPFGTGLALTDWLEQKKERNKFSTDEDGAV